MLGDRIRQARYLRGLSLRALAERAGLVSAQAISNYETGKDTPSSGVLLGLADALSVPLDYFFRSVSVQLGEPAYRKHCKLSKSDMAELECRVEETVERHVEAQSLFDPGPTPRFAAPNGVSVELRDVKDAEDRANSLREAWNVGSGPIDNLTELIEDHNVKVVFTEANALFDGCTYPDGDVPVIVVNCAKPPDRLRFDLAHELGHLLLRFAGEWSDEAKEDAAHRFAGAFLVPAEAARRELGDLRKSVGILELLRLKEKYGMSMQAWLRRAKDLGIVAPSNYNELYRKLIVRNGYKTREPGLLPPEGSTRLERLVARAYADRLISESRGAELLATTPAEFLRRISGPEPVSDRA